MYGPMNISMVLSGILLLISYTIEAQLKPPFYISDKKNKHTDTEHSYKILPDTIPLKMCLGIIIVVFIVMCLYVAVIHHRSSKYIFTYTYGFAAFLILLTGISNLLKILVQKERPDFYSRCIPNSGGMCTGSERAIIEGYKSFPSGHTMSCFGLAYFTLFFLIQNKADFLILSLVFSGLFGFSILVAVTRVFDLKHSTFDVTSTFFITIILSVPLLWLLKRNMKGMEEE